MSQIETGAEPTSEFRNGGLHHTCPCGETMEEVSSNIGRTQSEINFRCPGGHRWKRTHMIGFSAKWERLEGVGA